MTRLTALPSEAIISSFKGKIDYYLWKGIPCCRKWPRWAPREPYPLEKINQDAFAYAMKSWKLQPEWLKVQWQRMAQGTPWRAQDLFLKAYMKGLW